MLDQEREEDEGVEREDEWEDEKDEKEEEEKEKEEEEEAMTRDKKRLIVHAQLMTKNQVLPRQGGYIFIVIQFFCLLAELRDNY